MRITGRKTLCKFVIFTKDSAESHNTVVKLEKAYKKKVELPHELQCGIKYILMTIKKAQYKAVNPMPRCPQRGYLCPLQMKYAAKAAYAPSGGQGENFPNTCSGRLYLIEYYWLIFILLKNTG